MIIIGICGSSGAGKSSACRSFAKSGIPILNCDEIYGMLVNSETPCLAALADEFGRDIIKNHALDREKLAEIVFHDEVKRKKLNAVSHRYVLDELDKMIEQLKESGATACLIDAPLLFEAGLEKKCDFVIGVIAPHAEKVARIIARDGISQKKAEERLRSQLPDSFLRAHCKEILLNSGDESELQASCDKLIAKYSL